MANFLRGKTIEVFAVVYSTANVFHELFKATLVIYGYVDWHYEYKNMLLHKFPVNIHILSSHESFSLKKFALYATYLNWLLLIMLEV